MPRFPTFLKLNKSPQCVCQLLFIHSPAGGWLCCFHRLDVVNSAAVNRVRRYLFEAPLSVLLGVTLWRASMPFSVLPAHGMWCLFCFLLFSTCQFFKTLLGRRRNSEQKNRSLACHFLAVGPWASPCPLKASVSSPAWQAWSLIPIQSPLREPQGILV